LPKGLSYGKIDVFPPNRTGKDLFLATKLVRGDFCTVYKESLGEVAGASAVVGRKADM